jgi:hypothetical protein
MLSKTNGELKYLPMTDLLGDKKTQVCSKIIYTDNADADEEIY